MGPEEEAEVLAVLRSRELSRYRFDDPDGVSAPSKVFRFEQELAGLTGSRHCLGTNSCTSALLVGLLAAGVGPGDEVILPGYTFIAPIAAVAHTGAQPVLAEIDDSLLLDPADVAARITPRTKAVVAVHMLGARATSRRSPRSPNGTVSCSSRTARRRAAAPSAGVTSAPSVGSGR